ncbi:MAG: type II toxin-antitoxin system RelE/ParE family toxin [Vampirovibrionia bacterium]
MIIKWTELASQDLDFIHDYIVKDNPTAAVDVVIHVMESVEKLIPQNTAIGRPGRLLGTRELIITKYPYIVLYRILNNEIEVIRVIHTSMKWPENIEE